MFIRVIFGNNKLHFPYQCWRGLQKWKQNIAFFRSNLSQDLFFCDRLALRIDSVKQGRIFVAINYRHMNRHNYWFCLHPNYVYQEYFKGYIFAKSKLRLIWCRTIFHSFYFPNQILFVFFVGFGDLIGEGFDGDEVDGLEGLLFFHAFEVVILSKGEPPFLHE